MPEVEVAVEKDQAVPAAPSEGKHAADKYAAISAEHEGDAELFATEAAVVLANASAYWAMSDLASGLRTAMQSRAQIEQAKGILMASRHCGSEEAFKMLVQASQRNNEKLRDIAARIVDSQAVRATAKL